MNCNPFTFGHLYLIEYASAKVDNLIIFVVEENKSYFDFKDRFDLIKKGTAHLGNIHVIGSGSYIISTVTFPEYFDKDAAKTVKIDATLDLMTFCEHIAPTANISIRFVGEEPNCLITRQYNSQIKNMLPKYDIKFEEIPRKEEAGQAISASLVRKYIENNENEKIKTIVPQTTYDFLLNNYLNK